MMSRYKAQRMHDRGGVKKGQRIDDEAILSSVEWHNNNNRECDRKLTN